MMLVYFKRVRFTGYKLWVVRIGEDELRPTTLEYWFGDSHASD